LTAPTRGRITLAVTPRTEVLVVGAGGIAAPFAIAIAASSSASDLRLTFVDDDVVERSNLHRQILFDEGDVGRSKLEALAAALARRSSALAVATIEGRLTPESAAALVGARSLVVDLSDNFSTRFLAVDAAFLASRPVVTAAAVGWTATALAASPRGRPCYRCLFEDLPAGDAPDCARAGVIGPVCGVAGALAAELTLAIVAELRAQPSHHRGGSAFGVVSTYDGLRDRLRTVPLRARASCALCGDSAAIRAIDPGRYDPVSACAARGPGEARP
jgi:molybdopterin/thiamine biosynthesis adenylyltransferase